MTQIVKKRKRGNLVEEFGTVRDMRERLLATIEREGLDLVVEISRIAKDEGIPTEVRLKALGMLLNKAVPDLKAVDVQVDEKKNITIEVLSLAGVRSVNPVDMAKQVVKQEVIEELKDGCESSE